MSKISLYDNRLYKYAYYDVEEIFKEFKTSYNGISSRDIQSIREKYGSNEYNSIKNDTFLFRLKRAFINTFTSILFILAIISFITDVVLASNFARNFTTSLIICIMILISGILRFIQELKAKKVSDKITNLLDTKVNIRRNGLIIDVNANELVVGDVVILSAGNKVPADMRLIKSKDLFVSQSALTGESAIINKECLKYSHTDNLSLLDMENLVFTGTTIISGYGEGVILNVGNDTVYGNFVKSDSNNSFQKGATSISWVLIRFMMVLVPIVFIISGISRNNWLDAFIFSLSIAVGLTPEMLPMVINACQSKGSAELNKNQAIVKNINAMQTFGSMDILCIDKTGTLTDENIILEYYMDILGNESFSTLELSYLNSLYHSGIKNPIDNAILKFKDMPNKEQYFKDLEKIYQKIDEIPFDYERKFISILIKDNNNQNHIIMKGDINNVLSRCSFFEYNSEVMSITEDFQSSVSSIVDEMIEDGMKVIAIAKKNIGLQDTITLNDEKSMILVGYLAFFDAPKKSAKSSISKLKKLHIQPKILTGDKSEIAFSICRRIGIENNNIITGNQIDNLSHEELKIQVEKVDIFSELTPMHKVRVINALQENNHTVGFLGDGINDLPAMYKSNVAISVNNAIDCTKDMSDVMLLQKDLNVLEKGIMIGRKTFANMLKYIKITASSNFGNILSIVCASAFLPFYPMTSIQILMLNILYDLICIVLPFDNVDVEDTITYREWSGRKLGKFMIYFGVISSILDILTFIFLYFILCPKMCDNMLFSQIIDQSLQLRYISIFQTGWFLESMWTQILIIHLLRTRKTPFLESKPSTLVLIITLLGIVLFTIMIFTPMAKIFGLTTLPLWYFIFLIIIIVLYMVLITISKKSYISKYGELI